MYCNSVVVRLGPTPRKRKLPEQWAPTPLPNQRGLLIPAMARSFAELGVSASLWLSEHNWLPIHTVDGVTGFERELDVDSRRWAYNDRLLAQTIRNRRLSDGEHEGFRDLFVPVQDATGMHAILVVGPFAIARPTSADVLGRWHRLSGSHGRLSDPMFSRYLSATLATLTLEGPLFDVFQRFSSCFARLLGEESSPELLAPEMEASKHRLYSARFAERMWEVARNCVDERGGRPPVQLDHGDMAAFGIRRTPGHVVVGLTVLRRDARDPVADVLNRAAFQRACVGLGGDHGALCGQLGGHGVAFLSDHAGPGTRARTKLTELATRAAALARRFNLGLHAGISDVSTPAVLATRYRAALWAAEKAVSQGLGIVHAEPHPKRSSEQLTDLRAELGRSIGTSPNLLSLRFNRYVDAVLAHSGYRLERTRAELDVGIEGLVAPLLALGILDRKSFDDLGAALEQKTESARTVTELVTGYRQLVLDTERALQDPTHARQDRGMHRALAFIREHSGEPLSVAQVARVAGFAPDYFSLLFKREQGMSFGRFWQGLRIDRATQMLSETTLSVDQIQRLAGFHTRTHFHAVFKKNVGMTPIEYRQRENL